MESHVEFQKGQYTKGKSFVFAVAHDHKGPLKRTLVWNRKSPIFKYTSNGTGNACVGYLGYLKIFKLFSLREEDAAVS